MLIRCGRAVDRPLVDDVQPVALEPDDGAAGVGEQDHVVDAEIDQDLRADAVIAQEMLRPRMAVEQADPIGQRVRPGVADQHHRPPALGRDHPHRAVQRRVLVRAHHVVDDVDRVHAHQRRQRAAEVALDQHQVLGMVERGGVDGQLPVAAGGVVQRAFLHPAHQALGAAAVADQVGDGAELEVVALREGDQVRQPGHGAVIVHDLADHAGRGEPGQPRDVDRRLRVPGPHQRAAVARHQREHVAGGHDARRAWSPG